MVMTYQRSGDASSTAVSEKTLPSEILAQLDIRIGTIIHVERVPKSKKLYDLTIDVGDEKPRHILVNWQQVYQPEDLLSRQVSVCCNITPREMAGRISQGRLLSTYDEMGRGLLLTPERTTLPGTRVW